MPDPGFMIPLNIRDYQFPLDGGSRNICSAANQKTYAQAPWWTCENVQLTAGGTPVSSAVVGTSYVIEVGIEGLTAQNGATTPGCIQNVQSWVCFPNTVAGGASTTLVVPSMQNNQFASFSNTTANAPIVYGGSAYQTAPGFQRINLSPWTPTLEDFMEQSTAGGHVCIIANAAGQASLLDVEDPASGEPVGAVIADQSQLAADFNICHSLYQAQHNIVIVPKPLGGKGIKTGLTFLAGAPENRNAVRTTVAATAVRQGDRIDPVLLKALSAGPPYADLPLQPATTPPKSLRLARHNLHHHRWLARLIHEAEEIAEELLGLEKHPFGGGHQLHLSLPPQGLQPLHLTFDSDPNEPPGTVHAIDITQTNADGTHGGIRAGIVVTP